MLKQTRLMEDGVRIKTLYVRFYKSFNYDYLRKSDRRAVPDPWDVVDEADDRFFPFVQIPLEGGITTVVGANESGKSQVISAVKCLLTGVEIRRRDFCRYSDLLTVNKEMGLPEFGAEFTDLLDTDRDIIRGLVSADADAPIDSFWYFRFNKRTMVYLAQPASESHETTWLSKRLTDAQAKTITLPTYFEIHADVPLPNSVSLDYLTATKAKKKVLSRTGPPRVHAKDARQGGLVRIDRHRHQGSTGHGLGLCRLQHCRG